MTANRTNDATAAADRLADLRARIARAALVRWRMRVVSGIAQIGLVAAIAVATLFVVDWTFSPGRLARGLMLLVAACVVARIYWRRVRPGLAMRESERDMALAIEKLQGIDSDLVAALEFADGGTGDGSADLRDAVVDYVADFNRSWKMPREQAHPRLRRRVMRFATVAAVMTTAGLARPDVAAVFVNRMCLGSAHYPTRTRIESLTIGGTSVDPRPGGSPRVTSPLGRPLPLIVGVGGALPRLVRTRLTSVTNGGTIEIELVPDPHGPERARRTDATFGARLPKLAESVDAQVFAGDAWTDPVRVTAIPPPLIDLAVSAAPPAYAADAAERPASGARQVTVLEDSQVGVAVRCTNKKLASATLLIDGVEHPLRPVGGGTGGPAAEWEFAERGSPLARLRKTVAFEVRVVDEDGLGVDVPLVGSIRVKPDAPPRVAVEVLTRLVLPTAVPRLAWRVADDHAVKSVVVVAEALPREAVDGSVATVGPRARTITIPVTLPAGESGWVDHRRLPLEGDEPVRLESLGLQVGDQVRLTVRAADYRGDADGREAESDTIVLDVTDEQGILAALTETDERSVEQIDAIIDRELTVGGAK